MKKGQELVDIEGYLVTETANAYLIRVEEDTFEIDAERFWLPKGQVDAHYMADPDLYTFTMPEWLATDKGLV